MSILNLFGSRTTNQIQGTSTRSNATQTMNPEWPSITCDPSSQPGRKTSKNNSSDKSAKEVGQLPASSSAAPTFYSSCSSQLSQPGSSLQVMHNSNQDLYIPARRPKTPPGIAEVKTDDTEHNSSGRGRSSLSHPQRQPQENTETTKSPSPNNTPMAWPGIDSFGSMCKPSPNNTLMCDRYVQDRGAKYPDNIPDAPSTPPRMKDTCEVKYGAASPNIDRDNGMSGSKLNHLTEGKR